jgi:hypothetical protein
VIFLLHRLSQRQLLRLHPQLRRLSIPHRQQRSQVLLRTVLTELGGRMALTMILMLLHRSAW